MQAKRVFARFMIFALIGLLMEVFFGAGGRLLEGNWNMRGCTSPWMMLDYGLLGVVTIWLSRPMIKRRVPLVFRAVVYMLGIFFVEYTSGLLFHKVMGLHVWDYSGMPYNLHGQIALFFVIPWYLIGLTVEFMYKWVDACAVVFVRGLTAEKLERV
jgi:uncharacterized membrane protein